MADEENNGAVPPKVKLKINKPDADNVTASADSGPATIKIKPIRKVAPQTPVVPMAEESIGKPKTQTIQLKDPVDTSAVKVDLKPVTKKSETSKIALDSAVPKPITIKKAPEVKQAVAITLPPPPVQDAKSKTSRISLDSVMSSVEESEDPVAPTSRPKTVKLKRPVVAPRVTSAVEPGEEGITPTRKKTIKTRRPVASTPTVDLTAEEGGPSGPKLKTDMPQAGGAYIADRFAHTGRVATKTDSPHWMFAVVGIIACVLLAVTIYVQVAQLPNSGLTWVGQILQDQF